MLRGLMNLFINEMPNDGIVTYVRTEWGNETRHLSNQDCISFYNHYLKSKGKIKCQ